MMCCNNTHVCEHMHWKQAYCIRTAQWQAFYVTLFLLIKLAAAVADAQLIHPGQALA